MVMQTLKLCPPMAGGVFRKIIWPQGYSKKFIGKKTFRSCGTGESKHKFCPFDHSFEELKYDTGIANLEGRELLTAAYDDPPRIYKKIGNTVKAFSAGSSTDSKSKQL